MAALEQNGTEFSFSVLPLGVFAKDTYAQTEIRIHNEYVSYQNTDKKFLREELENWIFSMFRFLAGGYGKERSLSFENVGLAVDFYPYTENGKEVSREERRRHDCAMVLRILMRSATSFLGGVYSIILHREEIARFAASLREEYYAAFARFEKKKGKYLCVGVSPQGYKGCNYWYVDVSKTTKAGDYVWVYMGRRNTRQIVYVDSVRFCGDDDAPCDTNNTKRILCKATEEEVKDWKQSLEKEREKCL
ncbi:MAG: hypothetical protein E7355_00890 [Clostridiales bacterium]|nr:hypothetical protein [Clostridiales bacterium]